MDLVGIEPTTSSMPWKRAPSCATGPRLSGDLLSGTNVEGRSPQFSLTFPAESNSDAIYLTKRIRLNSQPGLHMNCRSLPIIAACLLVFAIAAVAQNQPAAPAPVSYSSVNQLNTLLGQLQQTSQSLQASLGKMRVDKWKTDNNNKRQAQANVESIQRNLQSALPEMVTQLQAAPEDTRATFKLYRNLDALYDVLVSVTESAGAFGSKDDFQSLSNETAALENTRRGLADRLETVTASKESEIERLRSQVRTLQAAAPAPLPKKIVVDDNEAPKKPSKKKAPKPPTASQATPPPQ